MAEAPRGRGLTLAEKVVAPVLASGMVLITVAFFLVDAGTRRFLEKRLQERSQVLENLLEAGFSVTAGKVPLQDFVEEAGRRGVFSSLSVAGGEPARILASTRGGWRNFDLAIVPDEELVSDLRRVLVSGTPHFHLHEKEGFFHYAFRDRAGRAVHFQIAVAETLRDFHAVKRSALLLFLSVFGIQILVAGISFRRFVLRPVAGIREAALVAKKIGWSKVDPGGSTDEIGQLAREIRKINVRFESQKSAIDQAAIVASTDVTGRITYANRKFVEISGYSEEELLGRNHRILHSGFHPREFFKAMWTNIGQGKIWRGELRNRAKDGSYYWVDTTILPDFDEAGRIVGYTSIRFDISASKKSEEVLRESERRFHVVANSAPVLIWMSGPDGLCFFFNETWLRFSGRTSAHEAGNGWTESVHPDDLARCLEARRSAALARKPFTVEYRLRRHDGAWRTVLDSGSPRFTPLGVFEGYIGSCIDIQDQVDSKARLADRESRLRLALDGGNLGIYDIAIQEDGITYDRRFHEMLGYGPEDLGDRNSRIISLIHPDDLPRSLPAYESHLRGETPHFEFEVRFLTKAGTYRWVRSRGVVSERDPSGLPLRMVGTHLDIHDAKLVAERFALALKGGDLGTWDWNVATGEVAFNERWTSMIGYEHHEIAPRVESWSSLVHPDDWTSINASLEPHLRGETVSYESRHRMRHKDGRWVWVLDRGLVTERDDQGKALRVVGTHSDISALQEAQTRLEADLARKRADIRRAQSLQQSLLPKELPLLAEASLGGLWVPSEELSGDFFDLRISLDGRRLILLMADCTGHGIATSMDTTLLKMLCDRHFGMADSGLLGDYLRLVNREARHYLPDDQYPTLFVAMIDLAERTLYYANAAGPLPLLRKADGETTFLGSVKGFPLNFDPDTIFEEKAVSLSPGDRLLFYSDAAVEVHREGRMLFVHSDLQEWYARSEMRRSGLVHLLSDLKARYGTLPLSDDLTAVEIVLSEARSWSRRFRTVEELEVALADLRASFDRAGWGEDDMEDPCIVARELGLNALEHGNRNDPSKAVVFEAKVDGKGANLFFEDEGEGFLPDSLPDPTDLGRLQSLLETEDPQLSHGRGVFLARKLSNRLFYHGKGNAVTAAFERKPPRLWGLADLGMT